MLRLFTIVFSFALLSSCKKEKLDPMQVPAPLVEEPDFILEAADLNYAIGTTWAYSVSTQTQTFYQTSQTSYYGHGGGTYTVKVIRDSNMTTGINGKVFQYFINGTNYGFKELQYVNPSTNLFSQITLSSVNGDTIAPNGFCIQLPLTTTSKWKNFYYPNESRIDSFNANGFENLTLQQGYLKCIKFTGNNIANGYWYNKKIGLVKGESVAYSSPNFQTFVVETSTITLTKFN